MTNKSDAASSHTGTFDDWWQRDGKYFDPDTDDVPGFDKRKELAEYAWHRAKEASRTVEQPEKKVCKYGDSTCPCPDGDMCHYEGLGAWKSPTVEPPVAEREPQWADCPRCHQKVLAPHECYESVLNEGEREVFEKWARMAGLILTRYDGDEYHNSYTDEHWKTWQAAYRAGVASRKGK